MAERLERPLKGDSGLRSGGLSMAIWLPLRRAREDSSVCPRIRAPIYVDARAKKYRGRGSSSE